ncbi:MAG TPA: magnesium/cobalt transporter CorA [Aquaticitalea sp.]|nr:magnesium/cobalt transporter CorA [Aquaticitalea sp.]
MKQKRQKKHYKTKNFSPGTIRYRGKKEILVTQIEVIDYGPKSYNIHRPKSVEAILNLKEKNAVTWINVNGLNNLTEIEKIGKHFGIHPLTLEDIGNTQHRPKLDEFDNYLFLVFKMLYFENGNDPNFEHVSMVVGKDYVLTFQEADGDVFDDLRERISSGSGKTRNLGPDYLMYAILDAVVDNYLSVIEAFGDKIEELEDTVFDNVASNDISNEIQNYKKEIIKVRRAIMPMREVISHLDKVDSEFIDVKTRNYIRDLYDHIVQVNETIEMYREMVWSLMDMHISIISNRMNEVMKVLTIIATIFIPLTFIAGVYGMNFDNMPELHYRYSYFVLLGVMAVIFILMLLYFKRKKWL